MSGVKHPHTIWNIGEYIGVSQKNKAHKLKLFHNRQSYRRRQFPVYVLLYGNKIWSLRVI